jgi:2-polyprenyl-3-methyl-5-hydroxy-6-metoxy-1,4-benzoquinol methylase
LFGLYEIIGTTMGIFKKKRMPRLHGNADLYWRYQYKYAEDILIPMFKSWDFECKGKRVLEIGCSEAGILNAFADNGCDVVGVEIGEKRVANAIKHQKVEFPVVEGDFCSSDILNKIEGKFDLIILRDVIEHLLDKDTALSNMKELLSIDGRIFLSFPSWLMPFGGHQQALKSPFRYLIFLHYLPKSIYIRFLKAIEPDRAELIQTLIETYDARLTPGQFRNLMSTHGLTIDKSDYYLLNPAYEIKFGWPSVKLGFFSKIPIVRDILTTSFYAFVKK